MEKITRRFELKYDLEWEYGVEIGKIREDLDIIEEMGATHVDIESDSSYDSSYVIINVISERVETDRECLARAEAVKNRFDIIKKREMDQLERLKLKYDK